MCPCLPIIFNLPLKEPLLPILIVSATLDEDDGSPTKQ